MKNSEKIIALYYPEINISGYTSVDGTVEFYTRINSLLQKIMRVLDYGAGRASWYEDDTCEFIKKLRFMKGKVNKVVGCDIDKEIFNNKTTDENILICESEPLPFEDESFDIIISDYTFEHFNDPDRIAKEFHRILKKGGWICARTPNKYCYISLLSRMITNSRHAKLLKYSQPDKNEVDTFPTRFKLNSLKDISKYFTHNNFFDFTYRYEAEPAYFFDNKIIFVFFLFLNRLLPSILKSNLFIFLRKK